MRRVRRRPIRPPRSATNPAAVSWRRRADGSKAGSAAGSTAARARGFLRAFLRHGRTQRARPGASPRSEPRRLPAPLRAHPRAPLARGRGREARGPGPVPLRPGCSRRSGSRDPPPRASASSRAAGRPRRSPWRCPTGRSGISRRAPARLGSRTAFLRPPTEPGGRSRSCAWVRPAETPSLGWRFERAETTGEASAQQSQAAPEPA